MIKQFDAAKALIDRLNTLEPGITVVTQGGTDAPTDGTKYLRAWVMPAGHQCCDAENWRAAKRRISD